jgi:hypothetical protein
VQGLRGSLCCLLGCLPELEEVVVYLIAI